jgi:hypothetical protein
MGMRIKEKYFPKWETKMRVKNILDGGDQFGLTYLCLSNYINFVRLIIENLR